MYIYIYMYIYICVGYHPIPRMLCKTQDKPSDSETKL